MYTMKMVLQRVGEKGYLTNAIREREAIWIGRVLCGDTIVKDILEGRKDKRKDAEHWMKKRDNIRV